MVATRERVAAKVQGDAATGSVAARRMAGAYLRYMEQLWAGDPDAASFERWLASCWTSTLPPAPTRRPDAVSPHGAGGRGIRWYGTAAGVVGYASGAHGGGYRVPLVASAGLPVCC